MINIVYYAALTALYLLGIAIFSIYSFKLLRLLILVAKSRQQLYQSALNFPGVFCAWIIDAKTLTAFKLAFILASLSSLTVLFAPAVHELLNNFDISVLTPSVIIVALLIALMSFTAVNAVLFRNIPLGLYSNALLWSFAWNLRCLISPLNNMTMGELIVANFVLNLIIIFVLATCKER